MSCQSNGGSTVSKHRLHTLRVRTAGCISTGSFPTPALDCRMVSISTLAVVPCSGKAKSRLHSRVTSALTTTTTQHQLRHASELCPGTTPPSEDDRTIPRFLTAPRGDVLRALQPNVQCKYYGPCGLFCANQNRHSCCSEVPTRGAILHESARHSSHNVDDDFSV